MNFHILWSYQCQIAINMSLTDFFPGQTLQNTAAVGSYAIYQSFFGLFAKIGAGKNSCVKYTVAKNEARKEVNLRTKVLLKLYVPCHSRTGGNPALLSVFIKSLPPQRRIARRNET